MAVFTHLETDTGTNVDISGATAVGAYTANGDKLIMVDVSIDAVAGNGDYVMYVTRQIGGSGSAYRILPQTTMTAASGLTAISGQSGWITVRNGDVLTVYIDGLAGDTSTPDWTTRWFEDSGTAGVAVASIATDAITAAALKADAVTKIQNGLATTIHVQEVENKVDLIDVTTVANSGKIDAVDAKVSAIDTDTIMSFMIDGFTFEQIIQIMASVLAGKLTRSGDTLTFRDLADTVNRVVAETDANKQRTTMTYTV